jgi:hypothetical protein
MTIQNYLIIESNVVTNVCLWDGNIETWFPPTDSVALVQATTTAMIWELVMDGSKAIGFELLASMGAGDIGFTWDGTVLTTNALKPILPISPIQPTASGVQPA